MQSELEQVAYSHVQSGLEYLQRWRLHNLYGQPVAVFAHPHRSMTLKTIGLFIKNVVKSAAWPGEGHGTAVSGWRNASYRDCIHKEILKLLPQTTVWGFAHFDSLCTVRFRGVR